MEYSKAYRQLVFGAYDILFVMSLIPCLGCICVGLLLRLIGRLDGCIHFWCGYVAVTLYVGCRQFLELSRPEQCSVIKKNAHCRSCFVPLCHCRSCVIHIKSNFPKSRLISYLSTEIFHLNGEIPITQTRHP
jgi:hypothetical protein